MGKVVSVINMKGGVGKSTLAVNLAWHFAGGRHIADGYYWRKKVLVIDLDPQFNASQYLIGLEGYKSIQDGNKPTVYNLFEHNADTALGNVEFDVDSAIVSVNNFGNSFVKGDSTLDLLPSSLELSLSLRNPSQKEGRLAKAISHLVDRYDLIIIDCAPTESVLTLAAYLSSDYLLVPVKPEYLSSIGLNLLVNSMTHFNDEYKTRNVELAGIVFNLTSEYSPEENLSKADVRSIAKKQKWYVFDAEVPYSRSFPKGAREGKPIFRTSYSRTQQHDRFTNFADEFAKRIKL
jgi:chromosome partitioning protein